MAGVREYCTQACPVLPFLALAVLLPVVIALRVLTVLVWWAVVQVHFENNSPFAVVEQLEREIEVSHWGNVYVTEHYKMRNAGAKHKGTFSRSAPQPSQLPSCWEKRAHSQGGNAHDNLSMFVLIANQTNMETVFLLRMIAQTVC
jgi:hypothetical protein